MVRLHFRLAAAALWTDFMAQNTEIIVVLVDAEAERIAACQD